MVSVGNLDWFEQLPCSVTVCDKNYTILYMNDRAAEAHSEDGGKALVGKNLLDCHSPESRKKLKKEMASGRPNVYTIEKKGTKRIVFHCQWKKRERVGGLVELSFELPSDMPNLVRT